PTATTATALTARQIERYRHDGFLRVPQVLTPDEVEHYRGAAERSLDDRGALDPGDPTLRQVVNVWRDAPEMAELTLHPGLAGLARRLAGVPLRLWHDQM